MQLSGFATSAVSARSSHATPRSFSSKSILPSFLLLTEFRNNKFQGLCWSIMYWAESEP